MSKTFAKIPFYHEVILYPFCCLPSCCQPDRSNQLDFWNDMAEVSFWISFRLSFCFYFLLNAELGSAASHFPHHFLSISLNKDTQLRLWCVCAHVWQMWPERLTHSWEQAAELGAVLKRSLSLSCTVVHSLRPRPHPSSSLLWTQRTFHCLWISAQTSLKLQHSL